MTKRGDVTKRRCHPSPFRGSCSRPTIPSPREIPLQWRWGAHSRSLTALRRPHLAPDTFRSLMAPLEGSRLSAQKRESGRGTQTERVAIGSGLFLRSPDCQSDYGLNTGYSAIGEGAFGDLGGRTRGMMR